MTETIYEITADVQALEELIARPEEEEIPDMVITAPMAKRSM